MISTECMKTYTNNPSLNREILRWINNRILALVEMYMDLGKDNGWDFDYLCICFPRDFVEEKGSECLRVLRELCDILESNYVRKNLKPLYKYVLIKIIEDFQIQYEDEKNLGNEAMCKIYFPPLDNGLAEKIYKEYGVEYNGRVKIEEIGKKDETNHPEFLIKYGLEDIDGLFWDDVFDRDEIDIDYIDGLVNECIDGLEQGEYIKWDLEPLVDLMSHDTKERYFKAKPLIEKVQEKVETIVAGKIMQEITQDIIKNPLMKNDLLMIFVKLAFRYREMKWISLKMKTVEIHIYGKY